MAPENLMIIIGISEYQHKENLPNATLDATRLSDILKTNYNFKEYELLLDSQATRKKINAAIRYILDSLPHDNVLIFFAGHGNMVAAKLGYWIPTEGEKDDPDSWCPNSELISTIKASSAKNILVISDACFSGILIEQGRGKEEFQHDYDELENLGSRWALTSGNIESVKDGEAGKGSPFSRSLLKVLEKNKSPFLAASQLYEEVREEVTKLGYPQKPQYGHIECENHRWGQMVFRLSASTDTEAIQALEVSISSEASKIDLPKFYIPRTVLPFDPKRSKIFGIFMDNSQAISLQDALIQNRKIVLLGTAGSGKSVELKHLAKELVKTGKNDLIPIYRRLNYYINEPIEELLPKQWNKINEDKLVLILDGLDEILPQNFYTAIRRLHNFSIAFPLIRIVISCRNNFYDLPSDELSGTLSDYTVYSLNDISTNEIEAFVSNVHGIDAPTFISEVHKNSYLDFASKPYFLDILIEAYKKAGDLSVSRSKILGEALSDLYKESRGKYQTTISYPVEAHVFIILEKIAFVMETMAKNFISEQELTEIVSADEFSLLKFFPVFKKNEEDGNWMFEHNNIQEFLASRILARLPKEKLLPLIAIQSSLGSRLKPTWSNTVSFYVSIADDERRNFLLNWLIENEPDALIRFEPERVPEDVRIEVFKQIFDYYNSKKIWIASNKFSDRDLAQFVDFPEIIDFLLGEINNKENNQIAVLNATRVLRNYNLNRVPEEIKQQVSSALINLLLDKRMDEYGAYEVMTTISALHLNDADTIGKFVEFFDDNDNQYIRTGLYTLIALSSHVNQYASVFFDGLDNERRKKKASKRNDVNFLDEEFALEKGLQMIDSPDKLKELLLILTQTNGRVSYRLRHASDSVLSRITENLVKAYDVDKTIFDKVVEYYKTNGHGYHDNLGKGMLRFFEKTKTKYEAFASVLKDTEVPDYQLDILLPPLLDFEVVEKFIQDYLDNTFHEKEIRMMFEFLSWNNVHQLDASVVEKVIVAAQQKDGIELKLKPQVNWKEKNTQRAQLSFNLLFDKMALVERVGGAFEAIGKDEIGKDDIGTMWRMNGVNSDKEVPGVVTELIRNVEFDNPVLRSQMVQDWINSPEFEKFQIDNIYHYLNSADNVLEVSDEQIAFIQDWCVGNTGFENQQYVWFFTKRFSIELPESQLLDFTFYYDYAADSELSTPGSIEQLEERVDKARLWQLIKENLSREDIDPIVWINNAAFALRKKMADTYPIVHSYLKGESESEYQLIELLKLWYSTTSDSDGLIDIIEHSTDFYFKWEAISLLLHSGTRNVYLQEYFHKVLDGDAPFDEKARVANSLIDLGDMEGFYFLSNYIVDEKNPNREYWHLLRSFGKLSDVSIMDKMMDLLQLGLRPDFQNRRYDGLSRPVLDAIFSIGIQSDENFKKVEQHLLKFIEDNRDTLTDIDFLQVNIIRMKEKINLDISKDYSLEDAMAEYSKLQL